MTAESAELTKLSLNCFITTKIAYANTIADIASKTPNANAVDILRAGSRASRVRVMFGRGSQCAFAVGQDSRVGSKCIMPGYGFGGPCFPRDNRALGNYAKSIGVNPIIPRTLMLCVLLCLLGC